MNRSTLPKRGPRAVETATQPEYRTISRRVRMPDDRIHGGDAIVRRTAMALATASIRRTASRSHMIVANDAPRYAASAGIATEARLLGIRNIVLRSKR